jgi:hypothetical protein
MPGRGVWVDDVEHDRGSGNMVAYVAAATTLRTPLGDIGTTPFEEFIDFYNGPGSFARWPPLRREAFPAAQQARGDLWDVLFDDDVLTLDALAAPDRAGPCRRGIADFRRRSRDLRCRAAAGARRAPHRIDGAGHMIPLTHPEPLTHALLAGVEG